MTHRVKVHIVRLRICVSSPVSTLDVRAHFTITCIGEGISFHSAEFRVLEREFLFILTILTISRSLKQKKIKSTCTRNWNWKSRRRWWPLSPLWWKKYVFPLWLSYSRAFVYIYIYIYVISKRVKKKGRTCWMNAAPCGLLRGGLTAGWRLALCYLATIVTTVITILSIIHRQVRTYCNGSVEWCRLDVYMYMYIYVCVIWYIYIYIYIYTHTHTYIL